MTAKTWNEVFARLDAFCEEFSAGVRAVADVDGTDEAEVRSLRTQLDDAQAALEAAEAEVEWLKRERDVLPIPDASNIKHADFVGDWFGCLTDEQIGDGEEERGDSIRGHVLGLIDRLEAAQSSKAAEDALVEKAARAMYEQEALACNLSQGWGRTNMRPQFLRAARALLAAGLLADGGEKA